MLAVLTLGIGATTAIFSVVDAVVMRVERGLDSEPDRRRPSRSSRCRSDVLPLAALGDAVRTLNPQAAPEVEVLDDLYRGLIATRRFNMQLLSMFGLHRRDRNHRSVWCDGIPGHAPYAGDRGSNRTGRRRTHSASIRSGLPMAAGSVFLPRRR